MKSSDLRTCRTIITSHKHTSTVDCGKTREITIDLDEKRAEAFLANVDAVRAAEENRARERLNLHREIRQKFGRVESQKA